ncbi:MAG: hypothetical protein ACPLRO_07305, partial [Candidatus Kapaibacteriota bacterium]
MKSRFLLVIFAFVLNIIGLAAQAPVGELKDYKVLPNLDTLVLNRSYGDWWFGVFSNLSYNISVGKLWIPERPFLPLSDTLNRLLQHNSKNGANLILGLTGEFVPKGS